MERTTMNILVTLNRGYIQPLMVMLASLLAHNEARQVTVYILHHSLSTEDISQVQHVLGKQGTVESVWVDDDRLADAPVTDRYPREMYYRIFAARYLPEHVERVLYLDPDLVVNGALDELYELELGECYFAAASHVKGSMQRINEVRLEMEEPGPYINSGVMLMNLALLRQKQDYDEVFRYIESHRKVLFLPDQDHHQRSLQQPHPAARSLPLQYDRAAFRPASRIRRLAGSGLGAAKCRHHPLLRPQ